MFGLFKKQPDEPTPPREFFKACNLYCHPNADQVIVVSVYNHGGLMAEKPGGATTVKLTDSATLDSAIRTALDACEFETNFNYYGQKRSDWPAYQASGYKTIKRFEAEFIRLLVKGVNEKNHFYDVTSPEFDEFGMHLTLTVNAHGGNLGEAVQHIVKNYLVCHAAISS